MVSVIIPHFNRTTLLAQTVESVKQQGYHKWEIIIVDDQSEEEEWQQLQQYASDKIKIIQRKEGIKGPSACRNLGVIEATGEYLLFLDSDDLLAPHCLQQRVDAMKQNPDLDAGVFLMEQFERHPGDNKEVFNTRMDKGGWIAAFIENSNPWNVTCPIWRKDSFEKIGGFDDSFLYMEDPDLHLRALYTGLQFETFYNLPPDCYYHIHHFDETKAKFYFNSILYRILFYQKLTSRFYSTQFIIQHKVSIKRGVNSLIRTFLYSRKNEFPELYLMLVLWMKTSGLFSRSDRMKYQLLLNLGNTNNVMLRASKIKRLCYSLLPN